MKRVIAAVCLLCVSVSFGVVSTAVLNRTADAVAEQAEKCLMYAQTGNLSQLYENSVRLEEMWDNLKDTLTVVTDEDNIEILSYNIPALKILAEEKAFEIYCEKCKECLDALKILKKNEEINLCNVL